MDQNTLRILSLDGGGARGYMQLAFLAKVLKQVKTSEREFWNSFDIMAGTSVGGIIVLSLAFGLKLKDIISIFKEKLPRIFTTRSFTDTVSGSFNASKDSNRPNTLQKILKLSTGSHFYEPAHTTSGYGSNVLDQMLSATFGNATLKDINIPVLIPAYQQNTDKAVIFSNISDSGYIGQNEKIVDVARATSAAPLYLPPHSFGGNTYIDGGIFCNNPTQLALIAAQSLKKNAKKCCVFSLGTGN